MAAAIMTPAWVPLMGFVGASAPDLVKFLYPIKTNPLRNFDVELLGNIGKKYITFYDFDKSNQEFYPSKEIHYEPVSYNNYQIDYLIRFADSQLTAKEVVQLQRDAEVTYGKDYVSLNSTKLQDIMKKRPGPGLEIGNLLHKDPYDPKKVVYPYKFQEALDLMLSTNGPIALYSHYYHNGILLFKKYLDENNQKGKYAILDPDLPIDKYEDIVNRYNEGKIKFLLIHPEITEGISLVGTRQMHILETPYNKSFQEQIIGRAVRYRSHMHLPEEERHVDIHIWKPVFGTLDLSHGVAIRNNWHRNFGEMSFYGTRVLVDPNNDMKSITPDEIAFKKMNLLDKNMESLTQLLKENSIESAGDH